ncbi:probable serine/threonine-protein kinase DDB_G0267686 [Microplitis mediator]|uniref:probable serine/threonine-protein kinase DDB_G0267686 n=1 Tax=Microplitis mediator TaxID=375433 RepID=UPI002556668C|nr:probable serine/threonine-protein kinase DDB_G0267686 [Microplitis mediator]
MSVPPPSVPNIPSLVVTAGTPLQNRPPVRRSLGNNLVTVPSTTSMVTTMTTSIVTTTPVTVTNTPTTITTTSGLVRTNNLPAINPNPQLNQRINNITSQASVDGVILENPPPVQLPSIQPNAGSVSYPGTVPVPAQTEQGATLVALAQIISCIQNLSLTLNSQRENTLQVPVQLNTQIVRTVTHSFGDGECGTGHLTQDTRAMTSSALPAYEQPGTSGTINVHRNLAGINNNINNNSNIDPNANSNNDPIGNNNLNNNINVDNNFNNNNYPIGSQINNANDNNYCGLRNNNYQ